MKIFTVVDHNIIYNHDFFQNFLKSKFANSIFFLETELHAIRSIELHAPTIFYIELQLLEECTTVRAFSDDLRILKIKYEATKNWQKQIGRH